MDPLEQVKKLREEYERALDVAESQRAAYHGAVLDLYRSGTPLREIARELGLSHQRVHQIVSGEPTRSKRLPRAAGGIGAALVLVAATSGALRIAHTPPFAKTVHGPAATAQEAASCLRSHGWKVAQHSSGVVVAISEPYKLFYHPSWSAGPVVETGWTGYGPRVKSPLIGEGGTKIQDAIQMVVPACFPQSAHSIHWFASSSQ